MQVNVVGRRVQMTPKISSYVEERASKLPHYMDRVQQVDVILDREGSDYTCEFRIDVAGHSDFISNAHHEDINACIDLAHDRAVRQLSDWKEKLRDSHR